MNSFKNLGFLIALVVLVSSCQDNSVPNYQYMPNMYDPIGYETYGEADFLPNHSEALVPPANTINRGWLPYEIENSLEGKEIARVQSSPLDSVNFERNLSKGAELYTIYCTVCHGAKGDGQGTLVQREKILGVPSYADPVRNITIGTTYYTVHYGLNSMGSYASQMNTEEMWQVSEYVMQLKQDLTK